MILEFKLDMPNRGSWDGKWSGEEVYYAIIKTFRSKEDIKKAIKILEEESYGYNFGDGWFASVDVREVDSKEAQKLRRKSKGFCNYDWMVESILKYNTIVPRKEWGVKVGDTIDYSFYKDIVVIGEDELHFTLKDSKGNTKKVYKNLVEDNAKNIRKVRRWAI